ncbi:MAG: carboxypeptidase regulatory-like domain-containing protein [Vicinamibacterales bacterium]
MQARFLRRLALASVLMLCPYLARAQTTTGAIAGEVKDASGGVLPGVTVEAASPVLIEKVRTVVTDGSGQFKIVDLRPGEYTVTFSLTGFSTVKREGVTITGGFTATINADMKVGSLEETIVVSGQSPIVDVQNVREQRVLNREVMDAIPTAKALVNLAALVPGVIVAQTSTGAAQDVGGTGGDNFQGMSIHGARRNDQQTLLDGMSVAFMTFFAGSITPASLGDGTVDQTVLGVSGHSAEVESGGIIANLIPKQGGNKFTGNLFANIANESTQADNYDDDLKARGVTAPLPIKTMSDFNPTFGGPIKKDKVWFFVAYRDKRSITYTEQSVRSRNVSTNPWRYVPDLNFRPVSDQVTKDSANRLTWQIDSKNRVSAFYDYNSKWEGHAGSGPFSSTEATYLQTYKSSIYQATWSAPVTNRLLFDAGMSITRIPRAQITKADANPPTKLELTNNQRFGAPAFGAGGIAPQADVDEVGLNNVYRGAVSYVTGSHSFKFGGQIQTGDLRNNVSAPSDYEVNLLNGLPNSVNFLPTPYSYHDMMMKTALYAQDQWQISRMTFNYGLRYDGISSRYDDVDMQRTTYLPARAFPGADVVDWTSLSPRLGWSWDVTGDGRTAVKVSASRYVVQEALDLTRTVDPTSTAGGGLTRQWSDANGDFIPQGDPTIPAANGELGPSPNASWGLPRTTFSYDPEMITGFNVRPYNWEITAGVQREIVPRVSANFAYFRRTFGDLTVVDNTLVAASNYDSFCVTAPTDSRLPGDISGSRICGLLDLNPGSLGRLQNLGTSASNYGRQIEQWSGFDLGVNVRLPKAVLQGGISSGRSLTDNCEVFEDVPEAGVAGIGGVLGGNHCRQQSPMLTQVKLLGSYNLPWGVSAAATFQSIPGQQILANFVATGADVVPSLGRNLAAGANATATVPLIRPNSVYGDRVNQIDLRLGRTFGIRNAKLKGMIDLYNLLNANTVLLWNNTYGTRASAGAAWLRPSQILGGRMLKFGVQLDF